MAAFVIAQVTGQGQYSKHALSEALDKSALSPKDKAFCTELVYGTLRFYGPLHVSLQNAQTKSKKIDRRILPHLLVAAYQLQHLSDSVPEFAVLHEAVENIKRIHPTLGHFANALLRHLGSAQQDLLKPNEQNPLLLSKAFGLQEWVIEGIKNTLPQNTTIIEALKGLCERPKIYVKSEDEPGLGALHAFVPGAYVLPSKTSLLDQEGYQKGKWMIQDPASQLVGLLLNAKAKERVLDLCAAPGGKSVLLAQAVGSLGHVMACEKNPNKEKYLKENRARMKVDFEILIEDGRFLPYENAFDGVLLDAPCSALGTCRRHPEVKWKVQKEDLLAITTLQKELLEAASRYVKKGGRLVYSVCSFLPQEGQEVIEGFLKTHPFHVIPPKDTLPFLPDNAITPQNAIQLWPHLHDCDAFFAICLKKD